MIFGDLSDAQRAALRGMVLEWVDDGFATPPYSDEQYDIFEALDITHAPTASYDTTRPVSSKVPFESVTKTAYGRYRLLWATDLIGETQRRGWIMAPFKVNTEHLRGHRETLEMEHEFERPDREDTVDLALALMVSKGLVHEEEPAVRKLLCMAYDESDRFGCT